MSPVLRTCGGRKANGELCGRAYAPEPGDTGRCPRCRVLHKVHVDARRKAKGYQSAGWRRARRRVADDFCGVPDCETPTHRLVRHHLVPRPDGSDNAENLFLMCSHDHAAYEAQKRAGRVTELTRFVDGIRDRRIAAYGERMFNPSRRTQP